MNLNSAIKILYANLKPHQQKMFVDFFGISGLKYVLHCSRRIGKTYFLCTVSVVYALKRPNSQIKYAAMTQKNVKNMIIPIMKQLFSKLPPKYRGEWNSQDGAYKFRNGSIIQVAGINNQRADDLRGTSADLAIVDEAAFADDLDYAIDSVLMPQLISTGGKLLLASSSPLTPAHPFAELIHEARSGGYYVSYTIEDSDYPKNVIEQFIEESGGRQSTAVRREYFNELIVDEVMSIVPEWNKKYIQEPTVDKFDKYYHRYESLDFGVRDKTALLLAKYNFTTAQLIVENEWTCNGTEATTKNIAAAVKKLETELGYTAVYCRVADNNEPIVINDLNIDYGIYFAPTNKDSLAAMVNKVRLWVQSGRLVVHPRCKELIQCLEFAVYQDEKRDKFGRSKALGHYDLLASLVYLVRAIDEHTNPLPAAKTTDNIFVPKVEDNSDIKKIFNI